MRFGINTLDEMCLDGKTVLCRVDINQPVDRATGTLKSTHRIEACVPTVRELAEGGAKVVLLAHQGSDIEYNNFYTTKPHGAVLSQLLGREVRWIEDVCGPLARETIRGLVPGEILLLDNVRFCSEEQTLFEKSLKLSHAEQAKTQVVHKLAPLADLYVCDAFAAAHRDQPTLCGFQQLLPSCMGRLFEAEYCVISGLMECPKRPCIFVLGGAKVADAFQMMETVLGSGAADQVLSGGLVGNILLAARGTDIGEKSLAFIRAQGYGSFIETSKALLERYGDRIELPGDLGYVDGMAVDIGEETTKRYMERIKSARTVFVNGPMGVFEKPESEAGTKGVWEALGATKAYTVVGGGDSVTATKKYGKTKDVDYLCTGGGALIRFLSGEELPVVKALRHAARSFGEEGKVCS
ncbi:MAG: phosphoglycerate kinase [Candidatus Excrementavichristensenella sp.]|jgi:phosphoglycerate kinase